jgi:hypothetical protein
MRCNPYRDNRADNPDDADNLKSMSAHYFLNSISSLRKCSPPDIQTAQYMACSSTPSIQLFLSSYKLCLCRLMDRELCQMLADAVAELARAHPMRGADEIRRPVTIGESAADRPFERVRFRFKLTGVTQQHRH